MNLNTTDNKFHVIETLEQLQEIESRFGYSYFNKQDIKNLFEILKSYNIEETFIFFDEDDSIGFDMKVATSEDFENNQKILMVENILPEFIVHVTKLNDDWFTINIKSKKREKERFNYMCDEWEGVDNCINNFFQNESINETKRKIQSWSLFESQSNKVRQIDVEEYEKYLAKYKPTPLTTDDVTAIKRLLNQCGFNIENLQYGHVADWNNVKVNAFEPKRNPKSYIISLYNQPEDIEIVKREDGWWFLWYQMNIFLCDDIEGVFECIFKFRRKKAK